MSQIFDRANQLAKWQSLHTPGHKGTLCPADLTELDDGRVFPADLVLRAQQRAAEYFGCRQVRFLTGGSSMGIKAAILAAGGAIIAQSTAHQSVRQGCQLAGVPLYLAPDAASIPDVIAAHPDARAVVLTSPDYFGCVVGDHVAKAVRDSGLWLIADSAHGAHLPARPDLFPRALCCDADVGVASGHKTLAVLTQASYLTINDTSRIGDIDHALQLLGTTSPSYLLLASLEHGIEHIMAHRDQFSALVQALRSLDSRIITVPSDDPTRLVIDCRAMGMTGGQMFGRLFERGIAAEMHTEDRLVLIFTICDSPQTVRRTEEALLCPEAH